LDLALLRYAIYEISVALLSHTMWLRPRGCRALLENPVRNEWVPTRTTAGSHLNRRTFPIFQLSTLRHMLSFTVFSINAC
jgi:hypothetical protein